MKNPGRYIPGKLYIISLEDISAHKEHPRKLFSGTKMEELQESVRQHGILQPILFTEDSGHLIVVAGERRVRAAREAGLDKIDAKYIGFYDLEKGLTENLQRENLSPVERSQALQVVKDKNDYDLEQLATKICKSVSTISEILSLNRLPDDVKADCLINNRYAHRRLVKIARADTEKQMRALFENYKDELDGKSKTKKDESRGRSTLYEKLINHVATTTKSIRKVCVDSINSDEWHNLSIMLRELEHAIEEKLAVFGR